MKRDTSSPPDPPRPPGRRRFLKGLAALTGAALIAPHVWVPLARADTAAAPLKDHNVGRRGVTLYFDFANGMFPFRGSPYRDQTVIVFIPHAYRIPSDERVDMIVHFHGHRTTAAEAMDAHQLREQLHDSCQNAILVMPQGPVRANDSSGGRLEQPDGLLNFLTEVRKSIQQREARDLLGAARIPPSARVGVVCLSAHSGGFQVAAQCLKHGGFNVTETYLFDALYGKREVYRDWVLARRSQGHNRERHKLISFFSDPAVKRQNQALMRELDAQGVTYFTEDRDHRVTREDLIEGRVIFIDTPLSHSSSTYRYNNLRDCLYASCLRRRSDSACAGSSWFDSKFETRQIEQRD